MGLQKKGKLARKKTNGMLWRVRSQRLPQQRLENLSAKKILVNKGFY
jgi:hypothetical protein